MHKTSFSSLRGIERAQALCDHRSLDILWAREESPLLLAAGRVYGEDVLLILLDGRVRGGTLGLEEATALTQFLQGSLTPATVNVELLPIVMGLDTGGVRVDEGPRALAATSAAGVVLAERSLRSSPMIAFVSGPRGCFGAPSVMAALFDRLLMLEGTHWGLTGPKLFAAVQPGATEAEGLAVTSARERLGQGNIDEIVPDDAAALREAVSRNCKEARTVGRASLRDRVRRAARWLEERQTLWLASGAQPARAKRRRRNLLHYSFRGQWHPSEPVISAGLVEAAWGTLEDLPALGVIVGPAAEEGQGIGVVEATAIVKKLCAAFELVPPTPAVIANFVFCQGHVVDVQQERVGLPRVLAECLRAYVAARLSGHTIFSVLGGGTYGAAYLALAAPSHRVFAIRGTQVAPMAPAVLKAFQSLKQPEPFSRLGQQLAEWIPEVQVVESIVRLPGALKSALAELRNARRPDQRTCAA